MNEFHLYYAEDDLDDLYLFQQALEGRQNLHLRHFENGEDLLRHLSSQPTERPCLIVLDLNMPVLDGRETLVALRQNRLHSGIPVILFTTSNSEPDKRFALKWDVDLITKPLVFEDMHDLADRLEAICKAGSMRSAGK